MALQESKSLRLKRNEARDRRRALRALASNYGELDSYFLGISKLYRYFTHDFRRGNS
jgi:hypothetical protein